MRLLHTAPIFLLTPIVLSQRYSQNVPPPLSSYREAYKAALVDQAGAQAPAPHQMNPGPVLNAPSTDIAPPASSNPPSSSNDNSNNDGALTLADVLPLHRPINIFASLTRDVSSVSSRLESTSNTTLLAPLNGVMQSLPRKPWEDRPEDLPSSLSNDRDTEGVDGIGLGATRNEARAAKNLQRFVENHVVTQSPWGKGERVPTLGGTMVWWDEDEEGRKRVWPGGVLVEGVVGTVDNGEVWALKGVVNYQ